MTESTQHLLMWLIPGAPLLAATLIALLGKKLLKGQSHWLCWLGIATAFGSALVLLNSITPQGFVEDGVSKPMIATGFEWINVGFLNVRIDLRADAITSIMLAMVTGVSLLVAMFASGYMHHDPGYPRFFAAFSLFVFSMCMLVLAGSFLMLFVFWEAVGLCSYLLIGFWFRKPSAAAAAKKAFVVNRIGDLGLLVAMFLIWTSFGSLSFDTVLNPASSEWKIIVNQLRDDGTLTAICLCLFLGAMGKSAQFPLHVWLPDAMEGPTPVSALIHAATMVTAGVYLVARSTPLFVFSPFAQAVVSTIGAITALIAALTALTQFDLKRVMAYSTVSQLGYMFMALGAAAAGPEYTAFAVTAAMFHLFTHAFFKALLFLASGSVMHAMGDVIDMRYFSGLRKALPITHATFLVGALALAGIPPLAGFFSKDDILAALSNAMTHSEYKLLFTVIFGSAVFTAFLTAFYTFRAYFMTFWGPEKFPPEAGAHPHEATPIMAFPLGMLALFAAGIGLVAGPMTHWFSEYLSHTVVSDAIMVTKDHPHLHWGLMIFSALVGIAGVFVAWQMYVKNPELAAKAKAASGPGYELSQNKFYFDELFLAIIVKPLRKLASLCVLFDRVVIDGIVDGAGLIPRLLSWAPRPMHAGVVGGYAYVMLLGLIVGVLFVVRALAGQ
ncbi:MAG TPA: NADH-quinone oxidoreductase subunit L [Caulifigura sp.]|nr:NADH-quinone oxidoreductase subunit L [Caulifigura sp.]